MSFFSFGASKITGVRVVCILVKIFIYNCVYGCMLCVCLWYMHRTHLPQRAYGGQKTTLCSPFSFYLHLDPGDQIQVARLRKKAAFHAERCLTGSVF